MVILQSQDQEVTLSMEQEKKLQGSYSKGVETTTGGIEKNCENKKRRAEAREKVDLNPHLP